MTHRTVPVEPTREMQRAFDRAHIEAADGSDDPFDWFAAGYEAALSAAPPVQMEAVAWRPIETAPKDGTVFDVWLGNASDDDVAFYCTKGTRRSCGWSWEKGKFRPLGGLKVAMPVFEVPTHWMPLPSPPGASPVPSSSAQILSLPTSSSMSEGGFELTPSPDAGSAAAASRSRECNCSFNDVLDFGPCGPDCASLPQLVDDATHAADKAREVDDLVEDIDEAADELIDSVQYLQETLNAGEELYESKWIGGVMRAHEMLLKLSAHVKQADAWPCDGEGDEYGNFVCKNPSRLNHAAAVEPPLRREAEAMEPKTMTLVERGHEFIRAFNGTDGFDDPAELVADLVALLEAAEKALEPFARGADTWEQNSDHARVFTTVANLRLARSVYQKIKGEG